jgi:DNA-binding IclR family transcriptional regulator
MHFSGDSMAALEELMAATGLVTALGARWERLVCYLFHGKPGTSSSRWLTAFSPMAVETSGVGMALLARLDNEEVKQLFVGHPLTRFPSVENLLVDLDRIRERGYSYTRTTGGHHTIGLVLKSNPNLALGIAGEISAKSVTSFLKPLRACAEKLDNSFQPPVASANPVSFL